MIPTPDSTPPMVSAGIGGHPAPDIRRGRRPPLARWQLFSLLAILSAGAFVRFHQISTENMWLDEIWAIEMSMGRDSAHDHLPLNAVQHQAVDFTNPAAAAPWRDIWTHMNGITHPPTYNIILRWWMDAFGETAGAARSLSAVFSVLALIVFFDIERFLRGPAAALLATAIMATAVGQIDFAQQTRGYAIVIFTALCAGDLVVRIEKLGASRGRLGLLIAATFVTAMMHYFASSVVAALLVYCAIRLRGSVRWRAMGALAAGEMLFAAVWGHGFYVQIHKLPSMTPDFLAEHANVVWKMLADAVNVPTYYLFGETYSAHWPGYVFGLIFILTIAIPAGRMLAVRAGGLDRETARADRRPEADGSFWILWAVGSIGLVAGLDIVHRTHVLGIARYSIFASPAIYALAARLELPRMMVTGIARRWRHIIPMLFIGAGGVFAVIRTVDGPPNFGDMNYMASVLDRNIPANQLVIFYNASPWLSPGSWYMGWRFYSPDSSRKHPWMAMMLPADAQVRAELSPYDSAWLVGLNPEEDSPKILSGWHAVDQEGIQLGGVSHIVRDKAEARSN